ncbi:MAG: TonB-dependent receptor [Thiobacillus sp.]|nr:TonB-dependent receptor [Thiobacillus sp.]
MRHTPLALALGVVCIASARAESLPEYVGETIVVTPTRFPQALSGQTANTTVITRQDIANSPQTTLSGILAEQAGIGLRDLFGNNAAASTVDMRGFGAAAGQNTLILLDGRRLNDIDLSAIDWSALPPSAIERIEIVRGGSSVLHGSGAVAGVINIISRSPIGLPNQMSGKVQVGSFNTQDYQLAGNYSGETGGIRLTADHYRSDGWRNNNETKQSSLNGDARFSHGLGELVFKFGGASQDVRLPGPRTVDSSIGLNQLETDPKGTNTPLDWARRKGYQAGLSNRLEFGRNELMLDLDYRNKQQQSNFDFGGSPDYRDADLNMWSFSPRALLPFKTGSVAHNLVLGVDFQWWDYALHTSNAQANIGTPINRVTADQNTTGLYARDEMQLSPATRLTLGGRYEWFDLSASDQFDPSAPGGLFGSGAVPGNQDETQYALELGLNHRLNSQHALFARLARSFRFATVDEIYEYSPTYSHEFQFLKPQTSQDAQVGWEWGSGTNRLRAATYYMKVEDEIHLDPYIYSSSVGNTNLPPLERYGIELEAHGRVSSVDLSAAYTLAYAKFTEGMLNGVSLDGKDVPLVPRNKLSLGAVWHINERTWLSVDANYVSSQLMENDETNSFEQQIPAYTLVDIKLVRQFGNWQLAAAVNNLFDEDYYTYAVSSINPATPDRFNAYPLPGRNGWVSVEYTFN